MFQSACSNILYTIIRGRRSQTFIVYWVTFLNCFTQRPYFCGIRVVCLNSTSRKLINSTHILGLSYRNSLTCLCIWICWQVHHTLQITPAALLLALRCSERAWMSGSISLCWTRGGCRQHRGKNSANGEVSLSQLAPLPNGHEMMKISLARIPTWWRTKQPHWASQWLSRNVVTDLTPILYTLSVQKSRFLITMI